MWHYSSRRRHDHNGNKRRGTVRLKLGARIQLKKNTKKDTEQFKKVHLHRTHSLYCILETLPIAKCPYLPYKNTFCFTTVHPNNKYKFMNTGHVL